MTRTRKSAKTLGATFERQLADYLNAELDDRIDRRIRYGIKDRGDVSGVRTVHGRRLVLEAKNVTHETCTKCKRISGLKLSEWLAEADIEAGNDDALLGVVVHKRRGTTDPGRQFVTMTVDDLCALIDGQRHGHRADILDDGKTA
jgi:creatinine amidohydrolase/Fe(II)-dependent formamide hydrolase-like protein